MSFKVCTQLWTDFFFFRFWSKLTITGLVRVYCMCDISFWMSSLIYKLFVSILLIMLKVSSFGTLVDIFRISKKYTHVFLLSLILCKSVISWMELWTLYVYGRWKNLYNVFVKCFANS
jgi:hypothetical protein